MADDPDLTQLPPAESGQDAARALLYPKIKAAAAEIPPPTDPQPVQHAMPVVDSSKIPPEATALLAQKPETWKQFNDTFGGLPKDFVPPTAPAQALNYFSQHPETKDSFVQTFGYDPTTQKTPPKKKGWLDYMGDSAKEQSRLSNMQGKEATDVGVGLTQGTLSLIGGAPQLLKSADAFINNPIGTDKRIAESAFETLDAGQQKVRNWVSSMFQPPKPVPPKPKVERSASWDFDNMTPEARQIADPGRDDTPAAPGEAPAPPAHRLFSEKETQPTSAEIAARAHPFGIDARHLDAFSDKMNDISREALSYATPEYLHASLSAFNASDPKSWESTLLQFVPQIAITHTIVGSAAKLGAASKLMEIGDTAMPESLKIKAIQDAAVSAGTKAGLVFNGGLMTGQTAQNIQDTINGMDESDKMKFESYRVARRQGYSDQYATQLLVADRTPAAMAAALGGSVVGTKLASRVLGKLATAQAMPGSKIYKGVLPALGTGIDTTASGAAQGFAFQVANNLGLNPDKSGVFQGAGDQAVGMAIVNLAMGGAEHMAVSRNEAKALSSGIPSLSDIEARHAEREAGNAKAKADVEQTAADKAEAERVTKASAAMARQKLVEARQRFLTATERVKQITTSANDPGQEVGYNEYERAHNERDAAFKEFKAAAQEAGLLPKEDETNGRTETQGSDGSPHGTESGEPRRGRQLRAGSESGVEGQQQSDQSQDRPGGAGSATGASAEGSDGRGPGPGSSDGRGLRQSGPRGDQEQPEYRGQAGRASAEAGDGGEPRGIDAERAGQEGTQAGNRRAVGEQGTQVPAQAGREAERLLALKSRPKGPLDPEKAEQNVPLYAGKPKVKLKDRGKQIAANYADIPKAQVKLEPDEAAAEHGLKTIVADIPKAEAAYAKLPSTDGGRIINTDQVRELSPEYSKDAESRSDFAQAVQEPASWAANQFFERAVARPVQPGRDPEVMFTAGGSGSGKSVHTKVAGQDADIVYDGSLSNTPSTMRRVKLALDSGRKVSIHYVYRDPVESFRQGVLPRALRKGRVVTSKVHAETHNGSIKTMMALAKLYQHNDRVTISAYDNLGKPITLAEAVKRQRLVDKAEMDRIAEEELKRGNITQAIFEDTVGRKAPSRGVADGRKNNGRLPRKPVGDADQAASARKAKGGEAGDQGRESGDRVEPQGQENKLGADLPGTVQASGEPLRGLPRSAMIGDREHKASFLQRAREASVRVAKALGRDYRPVQDYIHVDREKGKRIADAYEAMKDDPTDPTVKASYDALIKETKAQWEEIKKTGLKVEFIKPGQADPYAASPRLVMEDVRDNNHMWVFPTEGGFGHGEDNSRNPLLGASGEVIDGKERVHNDIFRIVHDYFGHIMEGNGFRADGEENAWRIHSAMYSDAAKPAMTSETRGQNSWVNWGPHGEKNRTASGADTTYAAQKTGLLPREFWSDDAEGVPRFMAAKSVEFRHFSHTDADRLLLNPKFYGTGLKGEEARRGGPKTTSLYGADLPDNRVEAGVGPYEYRVRVPESRLYDLSKDSAGLLDKYRNFSDVERAVKRLGFIGYHLPDHKDPFWRGQGRLLVPHPAVRVGKEVSFRDMHGEFRGDPSRMPNLHGNAEKIIRDGGLARHEVEAVLKSVLTDMPGLNVHVIEHPGEIPGISRWDAENLPIQAVFQELPGGKHQIMLIRANIGSREDALEAVYHEGVGHLGVRFLLKNEGRYEPVMDQIFSQHEDLVRKFKVSAKTRANMDSTDPALRATARRHAAEEVFAYAAGARQSQKQGVYQKIVSIVRDALRSMKILTHFNEQDIARIIDRARDFVARGGAEKMANRDYASILSTGRPRVYDYERQPSAMAKRDAKKNAKEQIADTLHKIQRFLTPGEREVKSRAVAKRIVDMFHDLPGKGEMSSVAYAGRAKKGWYRRASNAIVHMYGPDAPRFAALLASLSPQTSVEGNLKNAVRVFAAWDKAGRPQERNKIFKIMKDNVQKASEDAPGVLKAWVNNSITSLTHKDPENHLPTLSGPKVDSFMRNLRNDVHAVTLDSWMASYARVLQDRFGGGKTKVETGKSPLYKAYSARVRETAEHLSKLTGQKWTPEEVQETVWSWSKALAEHAESKGLPYSEILKNGDLTHELIAGTSEFAHLFHDPDNESVLRKAGYGQQLDSLRESGALRLAGVDEQASTFTPSPRHLREAANRLEIARKERAEREAETKLRRGSVKNKKALTEMFTGRDDSFWNIQAERDGVSEFKDSGYGGTVCTGYACAVLHKLGPERVKVYGFHGEDNPTSSIGHDAGGHDFAVVDGRYIVDGWLDQGFNTPVGGNATGRAVYDMKDAADKKEIKRLYGEPGTWKDITAHMPAAAPEAGLYEDMEEPSFSVKHEDAADRPLPWHSALSKMVNEHTQKAASPEQWDGILENLTGRGVKKEEIEYSGVKDWLDQQSGKITKNQISDYLAANELQIKPIELKELSGPEYTFGEWEQEDPDEDFHKDRVQENWDALGEDERKDAIENAGSEEEWKEQNLATELSNYYNDPDSPQHRKIFAKMPDGTGRQFTHEAFYGEHQIYDHAKGEHVDPGVKITDRTDNPEIERILNQHLGIGDADDSDTAQFSAYTLHGGTNYREVLFQLPERAGSNAADIYSSPHFPFDNIVAHVRLKDRVGEDGKKVLFVEEVQSDWHQQGRERGYVNDLGNDELPRGYELKHYPPAENDPVDRFSVSGPGFGGRMFDRREHALQDAWDTARSRNTGVPDAPFKTSWPEFVMKRVIRMAADGGYDRIAWTTGKQQADRYGLRNEFDKVNVQMLSDGNYHVQGFVGDTLQLDRSMNYRNLRDKFGNELAERMVHDVPVGDYDHVATYAGDDLGQRGAGMRAFYDKMLPNMVNKLAKKYGATVGVTKVKLETGYGTQHSIDMNPLLKAASQSGPLSTVFQAKQKQSPEMQSFLSKINPKPRPWATRMGEIVTNLRHTMQQGIFDQFYGMYKAWNEAGKEGPNLPYMSAHMIHSAASLMDYVIHHGVPEWSDGAPAIKKGTVGFHDIIAPLGANVDQFFQAMVARRASRLLAEGRENLFTHEEIAAGNQLWSEHPEFEAAYKQLAEFKKGILDFAQEAGVVNSKTRPMWENDDHIPFYRITNNQGAVLGAGAGGSLGRIKAQIHKLTGGKMSLGDPMENMIKNWDGLIKASLRNRAATLTADMLEDTGVMVKKPHPDMPQMSAADFRNHMMSLGLDPSKVPTGTFNSLYSEGAHIPEAPNSIWLWRDGQKEFWEVHDPYLYRSLTELNTQGSSALMDIVKRVAGAPKRLLTAAIVRSPIFAIKILARHSMLLGVTGHAGGKGMALDFKPVWDTAKGLYKIMAGKDEAVQLGAAGGTFEGAHTYDNPKNVARRLKLELANERGAFGTVVNTAAKAGHVYLQALGAMEATHRLAIAQAVQKEGGSRLEQAFAARDVLDYSAQGSFPLIQFLQSTVPFMRAGMSGLYMTGRRAAENPKGFALRAGILVAASVAYSWMNQNKPQYKALTDDQKYSYWHFWDVFKPGDHFQFPKPFEAGSLFGTVPEAVTDAALSSEKDSTKRAAVLVAKALGQSIAYDWCPTAVRPWLDMKLNRQHFSGAPILTEQDQQVAPQAQDAPYVSPTYRFIANHAPDMAPDWIKSPKQLQYLAQNYFGTLGQYATSVTDALARKASGETRPAGHGVLEDAPAVSQIYSEGPSRRTLYSDSMYTVAKDIATTYDTFQRLKKTNPQGAMDYLRANQEQLAVKPVYDDAIAAVAKFRAAQRAIQASKDLSPEDKQQRIDKFQNMINQTTQRVYDFRPGGKLNPATIKRLQSAQTMSDKTNILNQAGMPATAALLKSWQGQAA